jgi:hypothetical protein
VATTYTIPTDVIWPSDLLLPRRPPKLVYLDMLGWINMAEADAGNAVPHGYDRLLKACRRAKSYGRALFPLSSTHVLEVYDIASVARRRARAAIMEELSDFTYILGRPQIEQLEVEAALNAITAVAIPPQPNGPISLLGPSLLWSFGKRGGLVTNAPDPDAAAQQICKAMGLDPDPDAMASLNRWAERQLLTGPDDHDDLVLKAGGYDLQPWRTMLEARAEQERYLVQKLDTDAALRKGQLRDIVNAREMSIELRSALAMANAEISAEMNITLDQVLTDRGKLREFCDRMPSTRVAASLKAGYHRDGRHVWTSNDIHDIDALAIAVPYIDAVFTDKAARNQVVTNRELEVFDTFLPRKPEELADWLDAL